MNPVKALIWLSTIVCLGSFMFKKTRDEVSKTCDEVSKTLENVRKFFIDFSEEDVFFDHEEIFSKLDDEKEKIFFESISRFEDAHNFPHKPVDVKSILQPQNMEMRVEEPDMVKSTWTKWSSLEKINTSFFVEQILKIPQMLGGFLYRGFTSIPANAERILIKDNISFTKLINILNPVVEIFWEVGMVIYFVKMGFKLKILMKRLRNLSKSHVGTYNDLANQLQCYEDTLNKTEAVVGTESAKIIKELQALKQSVLFKRHLNQKIPVI